ncbi:MAG: agenet domain-containing protein [Flavobacteriales bacterium]
MRTSFLLLLIVLFTASARAQNVNDAVEIDFKGVWYPGKILKVDGEKYFVSYDEWDAVWNEWVGKERLRNITSTTPPPPPPAPEAKYKVGDRVEIQFGFNTANATVMSFGEGKYELKVDDMDTIWYTEDFIIRKL